MMQFYKRLIVPITHEEVTKIMRMEIKEINKLRYDGFFKEGHDIMVGGYDRLEDEVIFWKNIK